MCIQALPHRERAGKPHLRVPRVPLEEVVRKRILLLLLLLLGGALWRGRTLHVCRRRWIRERHVKTMHGGPPAWQKLGWHAAAVADRQQVCTV